MQKYQEVVSGELYKELMHRQGVCFEFTDSIRLEEGEGAQSIHGMLDPCIWALLLNLKGQIEKKKIKKKHVGKSRRKYVEKGGSKNGARGSSYIREKKIDKDFFERLRVTILIRRIWKLIFTYRCMRKEHLNFQRV